MCIIDIRIQCLGSISKLEIKTANSKTIIRYWLASEDAYKLHAPVHKNNQWKQYSGTGIIY